MTRRRATRERIRRNRERRAWTPERHRRLRARMHWTMLVVVDSPTPAEEGAISEYLEQRVGL